MEIVKLKCPSCGAALESEDDIEVFFCKYCGAKILFDRESDEYYKESFQYKTVKAKLEHEKNIEKMRMDERAAIGGNIDKKIKGFIKYYIKSCIWAVVLCVVVFGGVFLFLHAEQKKYDEIVEDLEECLDEKDYIKARELYSELAELEDTVIDVDDDIRNYHIEIEDLAREVNPDEIRYITMPRDSRQYRELSCYDAQEELELLGFYNVEISAEYSMNDVYSIQIDGNNNFTVNDEFPDNAEVIIIPEP